MVSRAALANEVTMDSHKLNNFWFMLSLGGLDQLLEQDA